MNSVSPVHVRVENHVKSRMMATNFQDFVEKNRKRVKIAPSTVVQQTRPARISRCATARQQRVSSNANKENIDQSVALKKSRSLSPKPRWCPPPARTTKSAINNATTSTPKMSSQIDLNRLCRLSDYDDLIPVKDRASLNTSAQRAESISPVRSCSVCKPRSPSPLLNAAAAKLSTSTRSIDDAYLSPSMIRHRIGQQQQLRRSPSASPPRRSRSWDEPSSKHSPIKRRQQQRGVGAENAAESSFIAPKREYLVEKLVETDAYANEIACHLAYVKDYLRLEASDLVANAAVVCRQFENDQNRLVDLIDGFRLASEDLKSALYDLSSPDTMNFIRQKQENEFLVKQVDALEMENNNYKKMLFELEKNMNKSGTANEALNVENNVLTNIRMCLEDNRAHLRRQLNAKESEINRLGVQLRELNRKLDRAQIENELLRENRQKAGLAPLKVTSSSSTTTMGSRGAARSVSSRPDATAVTRSIKLVKKYYNLEEILADPVKIRLYVEKLNRQLKEKESIIKNLNDVLISKQNVETLHAQRRIDSSSENDALREDNEKLKKLLESKDDKLKTYETNLKLLQKELKPNSDETSTSKNESELEKMRARLQKRLNELEPLPELLKTTELKLHESLSTNAANEATIAEYKRIVDELRAQVDKLKGAKSIKSSADKSDKSAITSARLMEVIDPSKQPQAVNLTINQPPPNTNNLDRLMLSVEEENRELLRQLGLKDEQIRDLSGKLSIESNKAASYSRQLDLALNDAKAKEQQLREKFNSNERLLKLKISELEAKLESNDFHSNIDRKDKDNMAHEYLNQIRDLNAKYEQVLATNKQMQEYINFMKNSYMSYFNDQPISSYDIAAATVNNNFIGLSQNNIF